MSSQPTRLAKGGLIDRRIKVKLGQGMGLDHAQLRSRPVHQRCLEVAASDEALISTQEEGSRLFVHPIVRHEKLAKR
jgi:hypothetical protein